MAFHILHRNGPLPMRNDGQRTSRRSFLKAASACTAHLALMASPFPANARNLWSRRSLGEVVASEPFGRLERVGPGLFTFVSTPLSGDYTTVCNGGIVVGSTGVLVIEAFQTSEGARWIADQARRLSGRWPTHILVSHYHGDHSSGVEGFGPEARGTDVERVEWDGQATAAMGTNGSEDRFPRILTTETTRRRRVETLAEDASPDLRRRWADVVLVDEEAPSPIDLGDRAVQLIPRSGHTRSDLAVDLPEEDLIFCGDLVWNGMFPNYMDALPSRLARSVRNLQGRGRSLYVPGHGPLADVEDFARYVSVLDGIEDTARRARQEGWTAQEAGERHQIPPELGEWTLFNPSYFQRAVEAWMMEWDEPGETG